MKIVLRVDGKEYEYWSQLEVNLQLNTVASTFEFTGLSEGEYVDLFKPFTFKECEVWLIDKDKGINEKLITGVLMNPSLSIQKTPMLHSINGFSKAGILEQVNYPYSMYPLQWTNVTLKKLAKDICDYFGLELTIHPGAVDDANRLIAEVKCSPETSLKDFLSSEGNKLGITVAHTNKGDVFLYKIVNVIPASSSISESDFHISMSISPNSQGMHSECTVIKEAEIENEYSGVYTAKSPFITGIKLPIVKFIGNTSEDKIKEVAEKTLSQEARNFTFTVEKEGWDFDGRIVRAGFYLDVDCPSLFLEKTKMLVESQKFTKDAKGVKKMSFTCVLPCVYTGKLPKKSPFKL